MRVLVCGGRTFGAAPIDATPEQVEHALFEAAWLFRALDRLHARLPITALIHGAAAGADMHAGAWAKRRGVPVESYPADWTAYGRAAGPIRNRQMLAQGKPHLVVAFPGGNGTENMKALAQAAGVRVWEPQRPLPLSRQGIDLLYTERRRVRR